MQLWAQSLPQTDDAENSQREWSEEYFAKWLATPQAGVLGKIPLIVLTRAVGGYSDDDYDIRAAQMEKERKEGQAKLAQLSTNSKQIFLNSGHNMELQAPDDVTAAIREVVEAVRRHGRLYRFVHMSTLGVPHQYLDRPNERKLDRPLNGGRDVPTNDDSSATS